MTKGAGLRQHLAPATIANAVDMAGLSGGRKRKGAGMSRSGGSAAKDAAAESPWITYVKEYRAKHGGTYAEALKGASDSRKLDLRVNQ